MDFRKNTFLHMLKNVSLTYFRTGLVESNIRKLVNDLEKNEYILIAHVNTEAVELPPEPPGHRFFFVKSRGLTVFSAPDLFRVGFLACHFSKLKSR